MHSDLEHDSHDKGPELLQDLRARIVKQVTAKGIDKAAANEISAEIIDGMRHDWGGQNIYFPKGISIDVDEKHWAIYNDYNGRNMQEVARKHGISEQWGYTVVKQVKAAELARRQSDMFDDLKD